ncbi:MAG: hypothetical protein NT006_13135 [Candidatus Aminicenantes bacterium]|nr:hypothetical protein [Candidatus Aminicenantes bacterium]
MSRRIALLALGLALATGSAVAQEGLPSVVSSLPVEGWADELRSLAAAGSTLDGFVLPPLPVGPGEPPSWEPAREALKLVHELFPEVGQTWLRLTLTAPLPGLTEKDIEGWVALLADDVTGGLGPSLTGIILEPGKDVPDNLLQLVVTSISVARKAGGNAVQIALPCGDADRLGLSIAAHVDRYTVETDGPWRQPLQHLSDIKILRPTLWLGRKDDRRSAKEIYLETMVAAVKFRADVFAVWPETPEKVASLLALRDRLRSKIRTDLSILVDELPLFRLEDKAGNRPPQAVFIDETFDTVMVLARVEVPLSKTEPWRFVSGTGEIYEARGFDPLTDEQPQGVAMGTANIVWDRSFLLLQARRSRTYDLRFRKTVDVSARAALSVSEIIARWQRYDAQQGRRLRQYSAVVQMDMHFQPPGLGSGFDIALHFRYFWKNDGSRYWEQTSQYLNGIKLSQKQTLPLPQLEPDKIVIRPLEIKLVDSYVYTLEGMETIRGRECYVVSFKPRPDASERLYSGRIWIDADIFRRARMLLVQDRSSGSIVGQTEQQFYEQVTGKDGGSWDLLVRSDVRQKMLAAGREFLLERQYRFSDFSCNSPDYDASLQSAFRGDQPMLTETAAGLRELAKDKSGERRIRENPGTQVWSLITGLIYDGTFGFPIPMAGLSAIDGDFLHSRGQMSTFWAGPILALNYSRKGASSLTWGADLYLSALPRRDRVFRDGAGVKSEELYYFSEALGARLRWQPKLWFSATATGYLMYEHYLRTKTTADAMRLPRNGVTMNPNLGLMFTGGGYEANLDLSWYDRLGWRSWGMPERPEKPVRTYLRASGRLGKQFYLSSFVRFGVDLGYYAGQNLDRFSSYQPSVMSSPKIRGIPSGTVSLDKIASLGLNLGFTAFDLIRIDGFYSFARCTENMPGRRPFDFQGLEFDFGTIGPWRSYIQGVASFAVRGLPAEYKSRWSLYLLIFIPLSR